MKASILLLAAAASTVSAAKLWTLLTCGHGFDCPKNDVGTPLPIETDSESSPHYTSFTTVVVPAETPQAEHSAEYLYEGEGEGNYEAPQDNKQDGKNPEGFSGFSYDEHDQPATPRFGNP
ncbi:hypothetical protein BROUX41_006114 [Berkeleyomyces rouxiae]|uniref:uncharacterized protein n=1 Tax=Berkeleyomyces rouxiae TaxID=2035830 RepID=UPI003B7C1CE0